MAACKQFYIVYTSVELPARQPQCTNRVILDTSQYGAQKTTEYFKGARGEKKTEEEYSVRERPGTDTVDGN